MGNVALKACEGTARYIQSVIASESRKSRLLPNVGKEDLKSESWDDQIDPDQFNGAYLLGLKQMIVKAHGASNKKGFYSAIEKAVHAVEGGLQQRLAASFGAATQ